MIDLLVCQFLGSNVMYVINLATLVGLAHPPAGAVSEVWCAVPASDPTM